MGLVTTAGWLRERRVGALSPEYPRVYERGKPEEGRAAISLRTIVNPLLPVTCPRTAHTERLSRYCRSPLQFQYSSCKTHCSIEGYSALNQNTSFKMFKT